VLLGLYGELLEERQAAPARPRGRQPQEVET